MQTMLTRNNYPDFAAELVAKLKQGHEVIGQVYTTERKVKRFGEQAHDYETAYWCLLTCPKEK